MPVLMRSPEDTKLVGDSRDFAMATTAPDGFFKLPRVKPGSATLTILADDSPVRMLPITVPEDVGSLGDIELGPRRLAVRVVYTSGLPASRAGEVEGDLGSALV